METALRVEEKVKQTGKSYNSALTRCDSGLLSAAQEFLQQHKVPTHQTAGEKK